MTVDALKDCNKKHLSQLAKERGISGWHAMRKDQLIRALSVTRSTPSARVKKERPAPRAPKIAKRPVPALPDAPVARRGAAAPSLPLACAAPHTLDHASQKDRIIVLARDPYWLHAHWELSRTTLARAQAALGQEWHSAQPILRLMDVTSEDTTNATERQLRDIPIHGGVNNWYIDVLKPPRSFRIDVGYLSRRGKFYVLARSNIVTTPKAGVTDALEENWASVQQQFERVQNPSTIGANKANNASVDLNDLFDERLRRPLSSLSMQNLSLGALPGIGRNFHFQLDAELIVYGTTEPNAQVTLQGESVQLRPDGTFTVRFSLPDSRQIIPAVASSADGVEERTIVLAVERNTKELEPMIHDSNEL
ncbi:DUF4912 domain-containing protein [Paludisphaera borealis]|uniref:Rho termination factor N-terminal domain-containing protein n=1 Tax=Paludisphaera borealis TaxID=1387353 RepID=A0A1U7CMA1_9BACT|nr:DUF4912 domain-containing protein [Paludisphaera borealis]APW60065.1 hypothetical protein BSF38_01527 [Paludisphaera borealis]